MKRLRNVETIIPAENRGADRVPSGRAGAGGEDQRQHAEDEGDRGHQDRPQPEPRRLNRGVDNPMPRCCSCSANSTIRMAFLLARPISITRPIWQ